MKTSTKFAFLAFGAASLAVVMSAPASALTQGGTNCLHYKDQAKGSNQNQCVTRIDGDILDKESELKRDGIKTVTWSSSSAGSNGHFYQYHRYSDGSGDILDTDTKTGITAYTIRNAGGKISTFTTRPGVGGSGGKRSTN
jgi:hypothetical protein